MRTIIPKKTHQGQILIIIMLVLAMISILLVLIARNVRKDATELLQSEQYEEYYNAVEEELLNIIYGTSPDCDIDADANCTIELLNLSNASALNENQLHVTKQDLVEFENLVVGKDKSVTIDLGSGYDGDLSFSWKGTVAWVVNIDYLDSSNGQYKTTESVYDNNSPRIFTNLDASNNCIEFLTLGTNSFEFNIRDCLVKLGSGHTSLSVRMRPIMLSGTTELTLVDADPGLPFQARLILATADIDDDLNDSPIIQLELLTPLHRPTLEILDYALRTDNSINRPN